MSDEITQFGPDYVLGGTVYDPDLNFRFEVWSRMPDLQTHVVDRVYSTWRRGSRKNVPKKNVRVRVQYLGENQ
jgi:hypothetical protein